MTLILGALGLWPHLEYRINARLNTGGTFQSQAVCHTTCLSACPVPKGPSQPGSTGTEAGGELDILQG